MDLCRLPGLMTQASRLAKLEPVRPQIKAASVAAVDNAGILKLKVLYTVNIKMWYHPKYYKELRKRNREVLRSGRGLAVNQAPHVSDQVISSEVHDGARERAPGPGPKPQATSVKPQAPSSDKKE